jgi:hypothetical protein
MNPSVVLTAIGAGAGLALLLVMAIAPLLADLYRPRSDRPLEPAAKPATDPTVAIPVQRGAHGLVPSVTRVAKLHTAPR